LECKWNKPCKYGCGYIHLDSATPNMLSNCCYNGKLSPQTGLPEYKKFGNLIPLSEEMQELFVDNIEHFGPLSSTYNNVLSMAAVGVENGNKATGVKNSHPGGFERRVGDHCVTINGRTYHFFIKAKDGTDPSGKVHVILFYYKSLMKDYYL
jgi:hypothetical protein